MGVLSLQGDSREHRAQFEALGVPARAIRSPGDLQGLSHLVLPGGESTTIAHLLDLFELWAPIVERHRSGELALFGTCAGAILLGRGDPDSRPRRMGLLDVAVERNAYGRQIDSFTRTVHVAELGTLDGVFIRAPRFADVGSGVRVLASLDDEPVLVESPGILAASFHPELTDDTRLHRYFLESVVPGSGLTAR